MFVLLGILIIFRLARSRSVSGISSPVCGISAKLLGIKMFMSLTVVFPESFTDPVLLK